MIGVGAACWDGETGADGPNERDGMNERMMGMRSREVNSLTAGGKVEDYATEGMGVPGARVPPVTE